jgi:hypothetical protein
VREEDLIRLRQPYQQPVEPVPDDRRKDIEVGSGIEHVLDLADMVADDLNAKIGGIGWWASYSGLGRQERVFISDYLLAAARSVAQNVFESYVHRLEVAHALEDFRKWMEPGIISNATIPPPRDLYDDLSYVRVEANLTGSLRAFASALDNIGACIVGVAGLPLPIVKTDLRQAKEKLQKRAASSARLRQLQADMNRAESAAGPTGWVPWLLAMRNMLVHRGRRIMTCSVIQGTSGQIEDFVLVLPRAPELTDIQGWVYAGGKINSTFEASADLFLERLSRSTCSYVEEAGKILLDLWQERKADPAFISQPSEQWREPSGLINPVPAFTGYDLGLPPNELRGVGVADEVFNRMQAAHMIADVGDVRPDPAFWA